MSTKHPHIPLPHPFVDTDPKHTFFNGIYNIFWFGGLMLLTNARHANHIFIKLTNYYVESEDQKVKEEIKTDLQEFSIINDPKKKIEFFIYFIEKYKFNDDFIIKEGEENWCDVEAKETFVCDIHKPSQPPLDEALEFDKAAVIGSSIQLSPNEQQTPTTVVNWSTMLDPVYRGGKRRKTINHKRRKTINRKRRKTINRKRRKTKLLRQAVFAKKWKKKKK